jgi:hypothetical protein
LADKTREKRTLGNDLTKRWLTLTVLLAAAVVGALVYWSSRPMSGAADADKARQAAEAKAAEATAAVVKSEQARQAAEAQAAEAEKARQVAAAKAADADKARQAAETKAADADKARQAASKTADDAEKARQAATAKAAEADKARLAAEAKAAEATDAAAKSAQARQAAEAHAVEADKARLAAEAKVAGTVPSSPVSSSGSSPFTPKRNMEARPRLNNPMGYSSAFTNSADGCEQICTRAAECNVWTYNKQAGSCVMYRVADLVPNNDYDSGIRK